MDDDEEWSLPPHDMGSIVQLTDDKVRKKIKKNPIGFVHFESPEPDKRPARPRVPAKPKRKRK